MFFKPNSGAEFEIWAVSWEIIRTMLMLMKLMLISGEIIRMMLLLI